MYDNIILFGPMGLLLGGTSFTVTDPTSQCLDPLTAQVFC